ncbi:unnamed protein product [Protopolystoma xenopodis]|uniref:Uncharacterized protein n=1 Tax=Protopolystoma xenopodis TaxID=117903 RepID=A0A448X697_9PLAT|nr:unnamed protein product [Protopolystoma xenopodis]
MKGAGRWRKRWRRRDKRGRQDGKPEGRDEKPDESVPTTRRQGQKAVTRSPLLGTPDWLLGGLVSRPLRSHGDWPTETVGHMRSVAITDSHTLLSRSISISTSCSLCVSVCACVRVCVCGLPGACRPTLQHTIKRRECLSSVSQPERGRGRRAQVPSPGLVE